MRASSTAFMLAAASMIPSSMAHFCFNKLIVNGNYTGEYEYVRKNNNSNSPVTDLASTDLRCNAGGLLTGNVTSTYKVAAGSEVGFGLDTGIGHPGPVQVYLSKVNAGDTAATYDGSGDWFKIYELGLQTINSSGLQWATNEIQNFTFPLSKEIPTGQYLMRVEAIALHGAQTFEGAQFYISCAQLDITSDSTSAPPASDEVKIPGVYTGHEPGIEINIYYPIPTNYTMPGPAVWPGNGTASNSTVPAAAASSAVAPVGTAPSAPLDTAVSSAAPLYPTATSTAGTPGFLAVSAAGPTGFLTATRPYYPSGTGGSSSGSSGTVQRFGKCGGMGHSGPTTCEDGFSCKVQNPYYSQCVPASS
ncbi:hypothetical protein AAFC00_004381 [Neodothiora populina]|uniref:lytic cellulose monooxygenase (C4-dehydrogenating) n=1 Tax=Neodothiora populina TaxID=2781224 RepID=A0ABR3PJJ0_9PEZI